MDGSYSNLECLECLGAAEAHMEIQKHTHKVNYATTYHTQFSRFISARLDLTTQGDEYGTPGAPK